MQFTCIVSDAVESTVLCVFVKVMRLPNRTTLMLANVEALPFSGNKREMELNSNRKTCFGTTYAATSVQCTG